MAARSILLVAQLSPPSPLVAARRTAGLAKYLGRLGHRVTVVTSIRSGTGPIEGAAAVVRTPDLAATALNWRGSSAGGDAPAATTGPVRGIEAHAVPDLALAGWLPFALRRAVALARRTDFDCVITSSPPASAHLVGVALRRRGLPWVADFRDGWGFDPPRPPFPLTWERRLDSALERAVVGRCDAAFAVTEPIVEDLRGRLGVEAHQLSNGFDPDERAGVDAGLAAGLLTAQRHSLVHTGRAGVSGRSPLVLFQALRELLARRPSVARELEVVFAGPLSADELRLASDPALQGIVRAVGTLERERALALQQAADSLLVIAAGDSERSVATGKLFEYLTAGPPVLVIGDRSEAAAIVESTATGFSVPSRSPEGVAAGLERLLDGYRARRDEPAIDTYSWAALAERASELIEAVCAGAPSRRPGG